MSFKGAGDKRRVVCSLCGHEFLPILRYCPQCGTPNDDAAFWRIDSHQRFVELWIDPAVHRSMVDRARVDGMSVEALYEHAAEFYLTYKTATFKGGK